MRVTFRATSVKQLARQYQETRTRLGGLVNTTLRKLYRIMGPILKANTPVRSGRLQASTRGQVIYDGANQVLSIRQGARTPEGAFYGRFVREGTRPHTIKPRESGGVLAFQWQGQTVFFKRVHHPGTKPNPYHIRTLAQARPQVEVLAGQLGRDIVAIVHRR